MPKDKTIEEKYQKLDQHEHILKRPAMYIGSVKKESSMNWIYNEKRGESEPYIISKEITYVPGLYKIYDEILVNASDHVRKCIEDKKELCTKIKVDISREDGKIAIWNNGAGIEVIEHKKYNTLIPSLIFGELLSGTNYNDEEKRKVGGMNGLGAKLANIYSREFEVETLDTVHGKKFYQKFTDNMYQKSEAKLKDIKKKDKPYTKISFVPDYERFGMRGLTDDMVDLFKKRVHDIAMMTNVKVYYNGEEIKSSTFQKYVDLYFPENAEHQKIFDVSQTDWRVCIVYDKTDKLESGHISFVNGISTTRGGTHVDHVCNQIVNKLKDYIHKKDKTLVIKPAMIRENLIFFVDAVLVNPEFDTQTKEMLKTKVADFSSTFHVSDVFFKKLIKTGVVDQIIVNARAKIEATLNKSGKVKMHFDKLYGAHKSNEKEGHKCTLILTEGDSAKTFAMSGLNVIGRDYYGVFPLRGKLLNVRDANATKITENEEIKAIINIIGLEHKKKYESLVGLKYGKIMILTDQDVDGSHIKGLIMNFIHYFWPSLAKYEGFIQCLATPLVKITRGKGKKKETKEFISLQEYQKWKEENDHTGWTAKYYKGLGTSKPEEAQGCFRKVEKKSINYYWRENLEEDSESSIYKPRLKDVSEDAITLAFDKKRAEDRKIWLNTYDPDNYLDNTEKRISYYDFIHRELIAFSVYDNQRSIPNIMDGLKPGQRKVLFGSIKKNIYDYEIKVAQLSGYISENTHYHHGEQSLNETIINMAQNYVGSNNINLLLPIGQFGSRLAGGKDASSPRYIHTKLNSLCKKIFIKEDFDVLKQQIEDNEMIEPVYYAPIIPMILVNGTEGIGTGYSTSVEPCNPRDICQNIKRFLKGEKLKKMIPWFRYFTGEIIEEEPGKYICKAKYEILGKDTIHITELPIGIWTDNYKAFLSNLSQNKETDTKSSKKKKKSFNIKKEKSRTSKVSKKNNIGQYIKNYTENCTEIRISFTIFFHKGKLDELLKNDKLETDLKLSVRLNLNNMHLFTPDGKIKKYKSNIDILKEFSLVRIEIYQKRKDHLLGKWRREMDILSWKVKFILGVRNGEILIYDIRDKTSKKESEIIMRLEELKFPKFIVGENLLQKKEPSYDYLTSTGLFSLTEEKIKKLQKELECKKKEICILEQKTAQEIWEEEIDLFLEEYTIWEEKEDKKYKSLQEKKIKKKK